MIMKHTPVQRLKGYSADLDSAVAPQDFHFGTGNQRRLKLLYGLA
jgi:hypothetical protein